MTKPTRDQLIRGEARLATALTRIVYGLDHDGWTKEEAISVGREALQQTEKLLRPTEL